MSLLIGPGEASLWAVDHLHEFSAGQAEAAGWLTSIDKSFEDAASVSLGTTAGAKSYAGLSFNLINDNGAGGDWLTSLEGVQGSGLVFAMNTGASSAVPTSATSGPRLDLTITSLPGLAGYTNEWSLRVWMKYSIASADAATNMLSLLVGGITPTSNALGAQAGFDSANGDIRTIRNLAGAVTFSASQNAPTHDVLAIKVVEQQETVKSGIWSAGWPVFSGSGTTMTTRKAANISQAPTASVVFNSTNRIMIAPGTGADVSGTFVAIVKRLRVEYLRGGVA